MALLRTAARQGCFALGNRPSFCVRSIIKNGPELQLSRPSKLLFKEAPIYNAVRSAATDAGAKSGSTTLWIAERAVSVGLIALVPAALAFPCKLLDTALAISMVVHTHWGIEAIISEYVRTLLFGPIVPKIAHVALIGLTVATLGGLFYLIFNDIGIANTVLRIWNIQGNRKIA